MGQTAADSKGKIGDGARHSKMGSCSMERKEKMRGKVNLAKQKGWPLNRPRENDRKCI